MVPSIYGENMFDDFFDNSFFGGHSPPVWQAREKPDEDRHP